MSNRTNFAGLLIVAGLFGWVAVATGRSWVGDNGKVDIRGEVKTVTPGKPTAAGTGPLAVILIEGDKQKDTNHDKASVKVMATTVIKKMVGKDRKDAKLEDLKVGCKVQATFSGPVLESYPVQATAKEIVILEPEPKKSESELLFSGPFGLDELYDKIIPVGSSRDVLSQGEGPTPEAIMEELKQCAVYVVARKIKREGKWGLTYDGGYPKVLAEGKLAFVVKDKKGRDHEISLQKVFLLGADMGPECKTCEFPLGMRLKVQRNFLTDAEIELAKNLAKVEGKKLTAKDFERASSSFVQTFSGDIHFVQDVDGSMRWRKRE